MLGFFGLVWVALVVILAVAPEVYDDALRLPGGDLGQAALVFLVAISCLIALLVVGVSGGVSEEVGRRKSQPQRASSWSITHILARQVGAVGP